MITIRKNVKQEIPTSSETWVVRWNQRYGGYSGEFKEVAKFFNNMEDALEFEQALMDAVRLLGHTSAELTYFICEKFEYEGLSD